MVQNLDEREIRTAVREKYADVARRSPDELFQYETGRKGARNLGYDHLEHLPDGVLDLFCGVGNPFEPGDPQNGDRVLDIGCGGGIDSIIAARQVAPRGQVVGVDLSEAMVQQARKSVQTMETRNVSVCRGTGEHLPFSNGSFDVVISNGVFNLVPDKPRLFREVFRVLAHGGRLQFADIILEDGTERPPATAEDWAG